MNAMKNLNELEQRRIDKYMENIENNSQNDNQIIINQEKRYLILEGKKFTCQKIEGYVKLPTMESIESIQSMQMKICLLPNQKMIIVTDNGLYFRGYKKNNTPDCFLLVHAVSEEDDCLIVDTGDTEMPEIIALDDAIDGVNDATFRVIAKFLEGENSKRNLRIAVREEKKEDEWE